MPNSLSGSFNIRQQQINTPLCRIAKENFRTSVAQIMFKHAVSLFVFSLFSVICVCECRIQLPRDESSNFEAALKSLSQYWSSLTSFDAAHSTYREQVYMRCADSQVLLCARLYTQTPNVLISFSTRYLITADATSGLLAPLN